MRDYERSLFWHGERADTAPIAELVRDLAARELATDQELTLARLGATESEAGRKPFIFDGDPAVAIFLREIERIEPDGQPFDRALQFSSLRRRFGDVTWEPDGLEGTVSLPTILLHGARDARSPGSAVQALAERLPHASSTSGN